MKVTVQVVIEAENGTSTIVQEVGQLEREGLQPENLGLKLVEAKHLLQAVQEVLVGEQIRAALAQLASCPQCGAVQQHKDARTIVVRTLFGTLRLPSPRWYRCPCQPAATRTFSPLAELLPERTTPELLYLEAKFAGLASYGLSAKLLAELLPNRPLPPSERGASPRPGYGAAARGRAGTRAGDLHRGLPAGVGRVAPHQAAADRGPRRRVRARLRTAIEPGGLVRGDRGQEHAGPGPGQVLRLRPDLRHQAQAPPLRAPQVAGDAGQPADHLPDRRRRGRARAAALPEPPGRARAGLVPPGDAPHGHGPDGQRVGLGRPRRSG